jgi:hypothetical protein
MIAREEPDMPVDKCQNPVSNNEIEKLIISLQNKDGLKRQKARRALLEMGKSATPSLIKALAHPAARVRWEAAKTLGSLKDPEAAPALVQALMDKSSEVQWLAAEGLIALKKAALKSLLSALIDRPQSIDLQSYDLRQGAHHVLHALERENLLNEKTLDLLNEIRCPEPELSIPIVAEAALASLDRPAP